MNRTRTALAIGVALAVTVTVTSLGYAVSGATADESPEPLGPGLVTIEVAIDYSVFDVPDLRVYEGTLVEFVVTNNDPINHELIVGDDEVHRHHEAGHDLAHPPIPGEVSVPPHTRGVTTFLFDEVGSVRYACHLPGHVAFGMDGQIEVVPIPK